MLTISSQAYQYILSKNKPIFLELPPLISCCIHLKESPSVHLGEPYDMKRYDKKDVQGITVYVPHELPDIPLTITLATFLGLKKLVIEGWKLA